MGAEMGAQRPIGCRSAKGCGAAPFCRDDERTALRTKSIPRTPSKRKRPVRTGIPAYLRAYDSRRFLHDQDPSGARRKICCDAQHTPVRTANAASAHRRFHTRLLSSTIGVGVLLLVYALYRRDPVFIAGQASGVFVYGRNLF